MHSGRDGTSALRILGWFLRFHDPFLLPIALCDVFIANPVSVTPIFIWYIILTVQSRASVFLSSHLLLLIQLY